MWTANKIYFNNNDNYVRAYQNNELIWEKESPSEHSFIYYTSTDGNIVTPHSTAYFDANIISNKYVDGRGVIEFDGILRRIGEYAFKQCSGLTSITIPSGVTSIENEAFNYCTNLTGITIPDSVEDIQLTAFYECSSLTGITIPIYMLNIGNFAFAGCSSLTEIIVKGTWPCPLGTSAFNRTNNCPIYVPSGSVEAYKTAEGWSAYADRIQPIP